MKGYIIGNGFDLSHGMSTKYSDFYKYLKKHDQKILGDSNIFMIVSKKIYGGILRII